MIPVPVYRLSSIVPALALCACASYSGSSLQAGSSTEAEVRATMGTPAVEFANPDGTRDLFFPRGPVGTETFRAKVRSDAVLREIRNVLTDDTFSAIRAGMTEQEILRTIGPPGKTMRFPGSSTHAWDYRYVDTWGYDAIFSVTFDANNIVLSKLTTRIEGRERRR